MYDLQQFNLIKVSENEKYFNYQSGLLKDIEENDSVESVLRLAILQTLSPFGDFEEADRILMYFSNYFKDIRLFMIGAYISIKMLFVEENYFMEKLKVGYEGCSDEVKSMICYLHALECEQQGNDALVQCWARKSIELCDSHVNNYLLLSRHFEARVSDDLVQRAGVNVVECNVSDDGDGIVSLGYLCDPGVFVGVFISGVTMGVDVHGGSNSLGGLDVTEDYLGSMALGEI